MLYFSHDVCHSTEEKSKPDNLGNEGGKGSCGFTAEDTVHLGGDVEAAEA